MITALYKTKSTRLFTSPFRGLSALAVYRNAPLDIHPEVKEALCSLQPVVALETAIVTHGMPYPTSLETAQSLEKIVRSTGSIPATIGIIGGRIKIGLEPAELERLAKIQSAAKVSRRDIGPVLSMKRDGGTTCSATMIFAALAGIKIFATGGLGGVHRGGHDSMDISADLHELARCPVGLVSAGVKSILDIGRTLEYLETLGVPVLSYGLTDDFPAFFSSRSGFKAPWRVDDPQAAARILLTQWQLGMTTGVLFGVPIPREYDGIGQKIEKAIEQAVSEAEGNGVSKSGKDVTPWLLKRVGELTSGESLTNNIALLQNTALVGGQIAVQYAKLANERCHKPLFDDVQAIPITRKTECFTSAPPAQLVVIGSTALDISARAEFLQGVDKSSLGSQSTSPGTIALTLGGVARNIAEAAHRMLVAQGLPSATVLLSPIGNDVFGRWLVESTQQLGMRSDGLSPCPKKTAMSNMVLDHTGSLVGGVADMIIMKSMKEAMVIQQIQNYHPQIVALDGNLSPEVLKSVVKHCSDNQINVFFEPTSVVKSTAIILALSACFDEVAAKRSPITFASPNLPEMVHLYQMIRSDAVDLTARAGWWSVIDDFSLGFEYRTDLNQLTKLNVSEQDSSKGTLSFLVEDGVAQMAVNLLPFFQNLVVKCGERGVLVGLRISGQDIEASPWSKESSNPSRRYVVAHGGSSKEMLVLQHFPPPIVDNVVNVTGAGDTLVGVLLASLIQDPGTFLHPAKLGKAIDAAQRGAAMTLQSVHAVSPQLHQVGI